MEDEIGMPIEIREGYLVKSTALQALYEHAPWAKGRTVQGIRKMLKNTDYHFSAWDDKRLVGFARVLTDRVYRATLWDVVIHPDYQGQGIGEALMNRILSHPVLSRVEKFWLNTRDKHGFYEKFGFVRSDQGMVRENFKKGGCCD
jgi:N-acetylglutamate synthase-like GNAT family acetyltransferase